MLKALHKILKNLYGKCGANIYRKAKLNEYTNIAIEYANNIGSIKSIRRGFKRNTQNSDLCNANVSAKQAYQNMYSKLHIDH